MTENILKKIDMVWIKEKLKTINMTQIFIFGSITLLIASLLLKDNGQKKNSKISKSQKKKKKNKYKIKMHKRFLTDKESIEESYVFIEENNNKKNLKAKNPINNNNKNIYSDYECNKRFLKSSYLKNSKINELDEFYEAYIQNIEKE